MTTNIENDGTLETIPLVISPPALGSNVTAANKILFHIGGQGWTEALRINHPDGTLMVKVLADGSVVTGDNYSPDEAAHLFWNAIGEIFLSTRAEPAVRSSSTESNKP